MNNKGLTTEGPPDWTIWVMVLLAVVGMFYVINSNMKDVVTSAEANSTIDGPHDFYDPSPWLEVIILVTIAAMVIGFICLYRGRAHNPNTNGKEEG